MKKFYLTLSLFALLAVPAPIFAADDLMGMYQGYAADTNTPLDQPHRSHEELSQWVSETVADALIFTTGSVRPKLAQIRPEFSDAAWSGYMDFLKSTGYSDLLVSEKLSLNSIVKNEPVIVAQGSSAGRYAWVFEMPVVMTPPVPDGVVVESKTATLRMQIGRSAQGVPPHGLIIESWQVLPEPKPTQESSGQPATAP